MRKNLPLIKEGLIKKLYLIRNGYQYQLPALSLRSLLENSEYLPRLFYATIMPVKYWTVKESRRSSA